MTLNLNSCTTCECLILKDTAEVSGGSLYILRWPVGKVCIQKRLGLYSYSKHALEIHKGVKYKTLFF